SDLEYLIRDGNSCQWSVVCKRQPRSHVGSLKAVDNIIKGRLCTRSNTAIVQYRERSDRLLHTSLEIIAKVGCSIRSLRSRYCTNHPKQSRSGLFVQSLKGRRTVVTGAVIKLWSRGKTQKKITT